MEKNSIKLYLNFGSTFFNAPALTVASTFMYAQELKGGMSVRKTIFVKITGYKLE